MTNMETGNADAIRYVVLRKLALGMRHTLMGELQAIQFASELVAQAVRTGATNAKLGDYADQIRKHSDAAVRASRTIIEWLRPDDGVVVTMEPAMRQCLQLAGDDWSLRGIKATTKCETGDATVAKTAFVELFVTSLFALTDGHPGPLDIEICAETLDGKIVVTLGAQAAQRVSSLPPLVVYRALTFDDVRELARAHDVACTCSDASVTLEFRCLVT